MAANYTPPSNLNGVLFDIDMYIRSNEYELLGLPQHITQRPSTYEELLDRYNYFHVKIRYDKDGQRLKIPIEFNGRFQINGFTTVEGLDVEGIIEEEEGIHQVTMIKDDGTEITFFDDDNRKNVSYYPIRYHNDFEKWVIPPSKPVPGELIKYKYPKSITPQELEEGSNYIIQTNGHRFPGKFLISNIIEGVSIFTITDPTSVPEEFVNDGYIFIQNEPDVAYFPVETIADEFRIPGKKDAVLQALSPHFPSDIARMISTEYGGYNKKRSNKQSKKKKRKKKKKRFTKRAR